MNAGCFCVDPPQRYCFCVFTLRAAQNEHALPTFFVCFCVATCTLKGVTSVILVWFSALVSAAAKQGQQSVNALWCFPRTESVRWPHDTLYGRTASPSHLPWDLVCVCSCDHCGTIFRGDTCVCVQIRTDESLLCSGGDGHLYCCMKIPFDFVLPPAVLFLSTNIYLNWPLFVGLQSSICLRAAQSSSYLMCDMWYRVLYSVIQFWYFKFWISPHEQYSSRACVNK